MYNRQLILENGVVYKGFGFGASKSQQGEVVFTTGMTGYQESMTDPSFHRQLLVFSYPLIGNYGVNAYDFESLQYGASGVIVGEYSSDVYHWKQSQTFSSYLEDKNIPGIYGIDTRSLVKLIRDQGIQKGQICDISVEPQEVINQLKNTSFNGHVPDVSPKKAYTIPGTGFRVAVIDYGIKKSILQNLAARQFDIIVFPYNVSATEILQFQPDALFLSNGPGDPRELVESIETIKALNGVLPIMGICLGHQLYALANGASIDKLLFGHRGANHPVYDIAKDRVFLTSQNHSYAVNDASLSNTDLEITHTALNDGTIEGLKHHKFPAFSVQYHPESSPGPDDSNYLFDEFLTVITEFKRNEALKHG